MPVNSYVEIKNPAGVTLTGGPGGGASLTDKILMKDVMRPIRGTHPVPGAGLPVVSDVIATSPIAFTNSTTTSWTTRENRFNLQGQNWMFNDQAGSNPAAGVKNVSTPRAISGTTVSHIVDFEFLITGLSVSIAITAGSAWDMQVYATHEDDDLWKVRAKPIGNATTGVQYRNITWPTYATRRVRVVLGGGANFIGLTHEAATIIAPSPNRYGIINAGDSYFESLGGFNSGSDESYNSFCMQDRMAELTNFWEARTGMGGCGYFQNGDGTARTNDTPLSTTQATRFFSATHQNFINIFLAQKPLAIVVNGTINDGELSGGTAAMKARITEVINYIKTQDPYCAIILIGPEAYQGVAAGSVHDLNRIGQQQAMADYITAGGAGGYINPYDLVNPRTTGTGYDNTPATSQQALLTGHDQIHPNYKGHDFHGVRNIAAMKNLTVYAARVRGLA